VKAVWLLFLWLIILPPDISGQPDLGRGLIAYLPFNNNTNDESGNDNHGVAHGIQFARDFAGRPGSAASFNGKDSYIEIPSSPSLNSTALLTIALKFYIDGPVEPKYLLQRGKKEGVTSAKEMYHLRFSPLTEPREIDFNVWEPESCNLKVHLGTVTTSGKLADNYQWHCLVGIFDGRSVVIYLDGIPSATVYPKQPFIEMCTGDFPIYLGAAVSKYFTSFKGIIDEVRIYNRALNKSEVELYSVDCGRPSPQVIVGMTADKDLCFPSKIQFRDSSIARGTSIVSRVWNFGDGQISSAANPVHEYSTTGTFLARLNITDSNGVDYEDSVEVKIESLIKKFAFAGVDTLTCTTDPVQLSASGGITYNWSPCILLNDCTIQSPILSKASSASFTVTVQDTNGCIDTDTVNVAYMDPLQQLFIPDIFSPNGDRLNDFFKPVNPGQQINAVNWSVYNRYGQLLFEGKDNSAQWDGTYKGKDQPEGAYIVVTQLKATASCPARKTKSIIRIVR
jgi:gliding motility-associated-like protein